MTIMATGERPVLWYQGAQRLVLPTAARYALGLSSNEVLTQITPYVHRAVLSLDPSRTQTPRYPIAYIARLAEFGGEAELRDVHDRVGVAVDFATSAQAQALMEQEEEALAAGIRVATRERCVGTPLVKQLLGISENTARIWVRESPPLDEPGLVAVAALEQLVRWRRPETP